MAAALVLQAGTMRRLAEGENRRVGLAFAAASLLGWIAMAWAAWAILDWCNDQFRMGGIFELALLGGLAGHSVYRRAYSALAFDYRMGAALDVVPGKIVPYAMASTLAGWRLSWRRTLRILWNWRWWPAVVLAALAAVWLPGQFFTGSRTGRSRTDMAFGVEAGCNVLAGRGMLGAFVGVAGGAVWAADTAAG